MAMPVDMMMLKKFDEEPYSPPDYIVEMRNNVDRLNYIVRKNKLENQAVMNETYDKTYDKRMTKNVPRRWRGTFLISKISSHNVFLYNSTTDKHVKKIVHINRNKPCYQRDNFPETDEDIEDIQIVEVTYPKTFPRMPQPMSKPEVEIPKYQRTFHASSEKDTSQIVIPPITDSQVMEPPISEQTSTDKTSTEAQHGSLSSTIQDEDNSDNVVYYDANPFWNALKIMRQNNRKRKIQYLIRWEDRNYPDTWSNDSDVNDELKRVFYLTHTKTGAKRKRPLENTTDETLETILECDKTDDIQNEDEISEKIKILVGTAL